jgi:SAM-dependent methyltransferase
VYSSHCLEHVDDPVAFLACLWGCVRPGGFLVIAVPHRDLYERKLERPSRWNGDHRTFWLPDRGGDPCTWSLYHCVQAACAGAELVRLTTEDEGWDPAVPLDQHPCGEYSIEGCWRKPVSPG